MDIIVDTREKKPLFTGNNVINIKLDEGDYASVFSENKIVIERKSPHDLYSSILKGHKRFFSEILRAKSKGKKFYIFVECLEKDFINKNFSGGEVLKCKSYVLFKIIRTMESKYGIIFSWHSSRVGMKKGILKLLKECEVNEVLS